MGVRIEQPQELVNRVQYGSRHAQYEERLGNADYSLVAHGRHDLFTFCMCAGGYVIPSVSRAGLLLHQRHEPVAAAIRPSPTAAWW